MTYLLVPQNRTASEIKVTGILRDSYYVLVRGLPHVTYLTHLA